MDESQGLNSIAEIDEEHFTSLPIYKKQTMFSSQVEASSAAGYAGDKEFQVEWKAEMIIQDM